MVFYVNGKKEEPSITLVSDFFCWKNKGNKDLSIVLETTKWFFYFFAGFVIFSFSDNSGPVAKSNA